MATEWVCVPGWDGFTVTRTGRIRGPSGRALSPMKNPGGHLYVTRGKASHKLYVHRAVLLAFIGPPPAGMETRHLNGDPTDNRLGNLAWGTRFDQRADDRRNGVDRTHARVLTMKQAAAIRRSKATSRVAAEQHGVSHTTIQKIRRGERYV